MSPESPESPEPSDKQPLTDEEAAALLGAYAADELIPIIEPDEVIPPIVPIRREKTNRSENVVIDRRAKILEYAERRLSSPILLLRLLAMLNLGCSVAVIVVLASSEFGLLGPTLDSPNPAINRFRMVATWFGYGLSAISIVQATVVFFVTTAIRKYRLGTWVYLGMLIAIIPTPWIWTGFFYWSAELNLFFVLVSIVLHGFCGSRVLRAMFNPDCVAAGCIKHAPNQRPRDEAIESIRVKGWLRPLTIGTIMLGGIALISHLGYFALITYGMDPTQPQLRGMDRQQFQAYRHGRQVGSFIALVWSSSLFLSGFAIYFRWPRVLALIGLGLCLLPGSLFWPIAFPFVVWGLVALFDRDVSQCFEKSR
jgi:hypothetical protein